MKKLFILVAVLIAVFLPLLPSCSNKNSTEACLSQTSIDLDKGNYDAVLSSSCADAMQIGAAWFGKAGYDITTVINSFIDANSSSTSQTDLNIYMTALVTDVTDTSLTELDYARTSYATVTAASDSYQDAQFYISLVDAMKSLSLIKSAIPGSINPDGTLNTTCDQNNNQVPDDADATACALLTSASQTCTNMIISSDTYTLTLLDSAGTGTLAGQYRGLIIQGTGTGTNTSTCPSPNQYKRLLFYQGGSWVTAALSSGTCTEASTSVSPSTSWPCPALSSGAPIDMVTTFNSALDGAVAALSSAITGTKDVQQSIQDIQTQACCPGGTPCATPVCTSQSIANYLETNLK